MTAGAQVRGAKGVVISGRCRDVRESAAVDFPVFARGRSTLGQGGFTRGGGSPGAVAISSVGECDAIVVRPETISLGTATAWCAYLPSWSVRLRSSRRKEGR